MCARVWVGGYSWTEATSLNFHLGSAVCLFFVMKPCTKRGQNTRVTALFSFFLSSLLQHLT